MPRCSPGRPGTGADLVAGPAAATDTAGQDLRLAGEGAGAGWAAAAPRPPRGGDAARLTDPAAAAPASGQSAGQADGDAAPAGVPDRDGDVPARRGESVA